MKALKYGIGVLLVGGLALTASCGGSSSDDSSSPSGGTGGTSTATGGKGTTTGGTGTTTGGTGTTTGGTGTTGTGGTITATGGTGTGTGGRGTAGTGTTTGGMGTGGATTNPATCPPATPTPMSGDPCTLPPRAMMGMPPAACVYGADTCICNRTRGGGFGQAGAPSTTEGTLTCVRTPIACPAMPATGDACTRNCRLPNRGATCICRMGALACPGGMGAAGAGG